MPENSTQPPQIPEELTRVLSELVTTECALPPALPPPAPRLSTSLLSRALFLGAILLCLVWVPSALYKAWDAILQLSGTSWTFTEVAGVVLWNLLIVAGPLATYGIAWRELLRAMQWLNNLNEERWALAHKRYSDTLATELSSTRLAKLAQEALSSSNDQNRVKSVTERLRDSSQIKCFVAVAHNTAQLAGKFKLIQGVNFEKFMEPYICTMILLCAATVGNSLWPVEFRIWGFLGGLSLFAVVADMVRGQLATLEDYWMNSPSVIPSWRNAWGNTLNGPLVAIALFFLVTWYGMPVLLPFSIKYVRSEAEAVQKFAAEVEHECLEIGTPDSRRCALSPEEKTAFEELLHDTLVSTENVTVTKLVAGYGVSVDAPELDAGSFKKFSRIQFVHGEDKGQFAHNVRNYAYRLIQPD
jgi:hypothetical protein